MASRTASGVVGKPRSAAALGSYYKGRTKEWLTKQGYVVGKMEHLHWIFKGGAKCPTCGEPPMAPVKRDELGADLIAIRTDAPVTFVQVKFGRSQIAAAVRKFAEYPFPESAKRIVVVWEERARHPDVIDCATYALPSERRRRPRETLF